MGERWTTTISTFQTFHLAWQRFKFNCFHLWSVVTLLPACKLMLNVFAWLFLRLPFITTFDYFPHLCVDVSCIDQSIKSLDWQTNYFPLVPFFFSSFDCIKGTSCVFSFCSLIFVQFICWIFLYRYLLTFTRFNEWTNFYQSQPNKSMISILIFPWIANIFSRFYQFFHRFQRKLWLFMENTFLSRKPSNIADNRCNYQLSLKSR